MKTKKSALEIKRHQTRSDDGNAFIPDPEGGPARTTDDLAETLAEGFVQGATQDEDGEDAALDGLVPEEIGGPFVESSAATEFADGIDDSNPADAKREAMPRPVGSLSQHPKVDDGSDHGSGENEGQEDGDENADEED
jgi:hypothetical protein